jgi:hypothetical protein
MWPAFEVLAHVWRRLLGAPFRRKEHANHEEGGYPEEV